MVKNEWSYTSISSYIFTPWYLVKHRGSFTFTFHFKVMYYNFKSIHIIINGQGVRPLVDLFQLLIQ